MRFAASATYPSSQSPGAHRGRALRHGPRRPHLRLAFRLLDRRHRAARARPLPARARPARRRRDSRRCCRRCSSASRRWSARASSRPRRSEHLRDRRRRPLPRRHLGDRLAALHMEEILEADELPLRYVGFSTCFRREAGAAGKDTRGHVPRASVQQGRDVRRSRRRRMRGTSTSRMLANSRRTVKELGLPYRVVNVAAGDLGRRPRRRYDVETWFPSQEPLPRDDVVLEHDRLPGAPTRDPLPGRARSRARAHAQRHRGRRPHGARDPGELPGRRARRAARLRRAGSRGVLTVTQTRSRRGWSRSIALWSTREDLRAHY